MGGVLDLISRLPTNSSEAIVNQTAGGGTDLVAFGTRQFDAERGATVRRRWLVDAVAVERAQSASLDLGTTRAPLELSGTLFASRAKDQVGLRRVAGDTTGEVQFVNASGPALVHGGELFAVYNEEPLIVTAFYALTRTRETSPESGRIRESPYVPRENAGGDVAFEEDESGLRVGAVDEWTPLEGRSVNAGLRIRL